MDEYDERTAIKKTFSHDTAASQDQINNYSSGVPKRYILVFMTFLGFANVYAMRVNLSVAIVAMTNYHNITVNGSTFAVRDFDWDPQLSGLILSSFFYGYIVTQLPGGYLAGRFGGKYFFGGGVLGTAVLTIITPPIARISPHLLIGVRVLEGLFEGVTYPSMHAVWSKWAPPLERTKIVTLTFAGSYFGTVVALPLSGIIADTIGWSFIFYIFGILAVIWFMCWMWTVTESPHTHPTISHSELDHIQTSIGFSERQVKDKAVPWKDLLLSLPVWAICFAHFAENWGFYTMLTELPTFLDDMFGFDLYKAGFLAATPYLVMGMMVPIGGQIADLARSRNWLSTTTTRKLCNVIGFVFQAVFMVSVTYTQSVPGAIVCLAFGVGFGGLAWSGFSVNHLDIAPQYAGVLLGLTNTLATIPGIVSPAITGHIVKDGTVEQWRIIFYLAAGVYAAGACFYLLFASGRVQPWAEVKLPYVTHFDDGSEHGQPEVDEAEDEN